MAFPSFTIGPPRRPDIHHDHGFLDDGNGNIDPSKRRSPTFADIRSYAFWETKLTGAQLLRPDLLHATDAYEHFLQATGADFPIRYFQFLGFDESGKTVMASALEDASFGAMSAFDQNFPVATQFSEAQFSIRSEAITVGSEDDDRYPYPATEDWQKAIGGHVIWIDGSVVVNSRPAEDKRIFRLNLQVHVEDMYNFNPGQQDIATGTPDSDNGAFEVTGLAKEFLSTGVVPARREFTVPLRSSPDPRQTPININPVPSR